MSAIMNPLIAGSMLPANNGKGTSVFAGGELSFVPTLGAAPQQSIIQDRPTTLFGHSTQHNTKFASARLDQDVKSNDVVYPQQYQQQMHPQQYRQQIQFQVFHHQQQQEQQQMQMQQATDAMQAQALAHALANAQPQTQVQAQEIVPVHALPQMTGVQQSQDIIFAAITKKEVREGFNNSITIDLRGEFTSNILQVTARGLSTENVKALAERVRKTKKESDKTKMIQVIMFGLFGYLMWRKEMMGTRLYKRLDPMLEDVNRDLVMQGINVRFAWTEGELHAYM